MIKGMWMYDLAQNRFFIFLGVYVFIFTLEYYFAAREHSDRYIRTIQNWLISITNTVLMYLVSLFLPLLLIGISYSISNQQVQLGFFNIINISYFYEFILGIILLDFIIWVQHFTTHKVPFLWRFHKVHHADHEMDVSTGIRFHPIEIFISFVIKILAVILLGIDPFVILVFEILLSSFALLTHANLQLPKRLDKLFSYVFVTPNMHVIHHNPNRELHDNNYGFCLSIWDRLFKTYVSYWTVDKPIIGLANEKSQHNRYLKLIMLPFK